ncbi:hypothetical protein F4556_003482 [Kitasatospora gansuensis]|uniref:Lipoprotein n=1 Tax=Kitasatospora gansuensis TaxID=258050 RepID=A0A7W7SD87_9ACTN|nr:hypothetical protein [Kitasatospora gansuensis]MBB4947947.1 hypothetical protein [Kitasatospora gansuensis]
MRTARIAAAALLLPLAVALTACGASGTAAPERSPKDTLKAAVAVMAQVGSAEVALDGGWSGRASWRPGVRLTLSGAADTQLLALGEGFYVRAADTGARTGGRVWEKLAGPFESAGRGEALGLGPALAFSQRLDPAGALEQAARGTVTEVGRESIDGVAATHYRAVLDGAEYFADGRGLNDERRRALAAAFRASGPTTATVDLWLNGADQLVQKTESGNPTVTDGTSTVRYAHLGTPVDLTPPSSVDVLDPMTAAG